jgi:hypothetical protein
MKSAFPAQPRARRNPCAFHQDNLKTALLPPSFLSAGCRLFADGIRGFSALEYHIIIKK